MDLIKIDPRPYLEQRLARRGMSWFSGPQEPTWFEHKAYVFTQAEIARLRSGADEILAMIPSTGTAAMTSTGARRRTSPVSAATTS